MKHVQHGLRIIEHLSTTISPYCKSGAAISNGFRTIDGTPSGRDQQIPTIKLLIMFTKNPLQKSLNLATVALWVSDFEYCVFALLVSVVSCMDVKHGFGTWIRCTNMAIAKRSRSEYTIRSAETLLFALQLLLSQFISFGVSFRSIFFFCRLLALWRCGNKPRDTSLGMTVQPN